MLEHTTAGVKQSEGTPSLGGDAAWLIGSAVREARLPSQNLHDRNSARPAELVFCGADLSARATRLPAELVLSRV